MVAKPRIIVKWHGPVKKLVTTQPQRKPMRRISKKRYKECQEYSKRRAAFLERVENRYCPVMWEIFERTVYATEIHHKDGREGGLLNDKRQWLAVSVRGHHWIHKHPNEARQHGWLI